MNSRVFNHCRENLSCKKIILNAASGCIAGRFFGIHPVRGAVCAVASHTAIYVTGLVTVLIFSKIYNLSCKGQRGE